MNSGPVPWAEHKINTRAKIVEAAVDLFEQSGFNDVTIEDIAGRAGVSPRTVHRYCTSKDRIIIEDDPDEIPMFIRVLERQDPDLSMGEAILAALTVFAPIPDGDHDVMIRRIRLILVTPAIRDVWTVRLRELEEGLLPWISSKMGREPEDLAVRAQSAAIVGGYRLMTEILAERGVEAYEQIATEVISIVVADGWPDSLS